MERGDDAPRDLYDLVGRLKPVSEQLFGCRSYLREFEDDAVLEPYRMAETDLPDGVLRIRPAVAKRLRRLLEGQPITTPRLQQQVTTDLLTLLHESIHLLGPQTLARKMAAQAPSGDHAAAAFSEGFVEWLADDRLRDFIVALGLHHNNPWLLNTEPELCYQPMLGAVGELVTHIASVRGVSVRNQADELLREGVPSFAIDLICKRWLEALGLNPTRTQCAEVRSAIDAMLNDARVGSRRDGQRLAKYRISAINRQLAQQAARNQRGVA